MSTFGNTAAPTNEDTTGAYRAASKFTVSEAFTLTGLSGYCRNATGTNTVVLALVDDNAGTPGVHLINTGSISEPVNASLQLVNGSVTPTVFAAGTYYIELVNASDAANPDGHRIGFTGVGTATLQYCQGVGLEPDDGWLSESDPGAIDGTLCAFATYTAVSSGTTVTPTGLSVTVSRGTPTVVRVSNPTVHPTGFGLAVSRGTPTVSTVSNPTVQPTGFGVTVSLGAPTISIASNPTVQPTGFGVTASLGVPTLSANGNVTIQPDGFALATSLGALAIRADASIAATGFGLSLALGAPHVGTGAGDANGAFDGHLEVFPRLAGEIAVFPQMDGEMRVFPRLTGCIRVYPLDRA